MRHHRGNLSNIRPDKAEDILGVAKMALQLHPNSVTARRDVAIAYLLLGQAYERARQLTRAEQPLKKGIAILDEMKEKELLDGKYLQLLADAHNDLGYTYLRSSRLSLAGEHIGRSVKLYGDLHRQSCDPSQYDIQYSAMQANLALVRVKENKRREATELLSSARARLGSLNADRRNDAQVRRVLRSLSDLERAARRIR